MPNTFSISFSPIKRRTIQLKAAPPAVVDEPYRDRLLHTGLITTQASTTVFTSVGNPLPSDAPVNSSGTITTPLSTPPHINPQNLKYRVRVIDVTNPSNIYWSDLVEAQTIGQNVQITLSTALPSTLLSGSRWDIFYPADDGVRYTSTITDLQSAGLQVTGNAGSSVELLSLITNGSQPNVHPDFDLVAILDDGTVQRRTITSATYVDDATPVVFTIDSAFSGVVLGDTIMVKSAKWTGFCNPLFDANPLPDLTPLISTSAVFTDAPFDVDVVMGDGNAVQSGFFDFEITPESGLVRWFGNTLIGQKDSSQALVVDQVGPELITASEPLAPYDTKLTWQGILLGSTNFISEQDAETLTSGVLNASGLHLHDDIYRRLDQTLDHNSDLVGIQGGNPPSEAYHLTSDEYSKLSNFVANPSFVFTPLTSPFVINLKTSSSVNAQNWFLFNNSTYNIPEQAIIVGRILASDGNRPGPESNLVIYIRGLEESNVVPSHTFPNIGDEVLAWAVDRLGDSDGSSEFTRADHQWSVIFLPISGIYNGGFKLAVSVFNVNIPWSSALRASLKVLGYYSPAF